MEASISFASPAGNWTRLVKATHTVWALVRVRQPDAPEGAQAEGRAPVEGPLADALNQPQRLKWERAILERIRRGRSEAFGELYGAYGKVLYTRVLMPKLGNPAAAEDALSETFRTGFERISQFEPRGTSIYFWLARIASNKAMDMHRARGVTGRALVNLEEQLAVLLEAPLTPDDVVHGKAEYLAVRERLDAALAALNPRYRRAIELRFFEELDRECCAEVLKVKLGTFDVVLLRAVKALRKQWRPASSNSVKEASDVEALG